MRRRLCLDGAAVLDDARRQSEIGSGKYRMLKILGFSHGGRLAKRRIRGKGKK